MLKSLLVVISSFLAFGAFAQTSGLEKFVNYNGLDKDDLDPTVKFQLEVSYGKHTLFLSNLNSEMMNYLPKIASSNFCTQSIMDFIASEDKNNHPVLASLSEISGSQLQKMQFTVQAHLAETTLVVDDVQLYTYHPFVSATGNTNAWNTKNSDCTIATLVERLKSQIKAQKPENDEIERKNKAAIDAFKKLIK